ncbi:hypothetical protein XENOCAPTIV_001244 [Xenoophorus captivus]|uniref:Uncharacterized protein n=1 Tax=Xenoophorus captivus TaxID=1517983 RepID=A0ABV0RWL8_9TELE
MNCFSFLITFRWTSHRDKLHILTPETNPTYLFSLDQPETVLRVLKHVTTVTIKAKLHWEPFTILPLTQSNLQGLSSSLLRHLLQSEDIINADVCICELSP